MDITYVLPRNPSIVPVSFISFRNIQYMIFTSQLQNLQNTEHLQGKNQQLDVSKRSCRGCYGEECSSVYTLPGPGLYFLSIFGVMGTFHINLVHCFVFSSLIVAVDPVAVSMSANHYDQCTIASFSRFVQQHIKHSHLHNQHIKIQC